MMMRIEIITEKMTDDDNNDDDKDNLGNHICISDSLYP